MSDKEKTIDLEQAMTELREIVEDIEKSPMKLEEMIEMYEKAGKLALICRSKLAEAQLRITDINERLEELNNKNKTEA